MKLPGFSNDQIDEIYKLQLSNLGIGETDTPQIYTAAAISVYHQWLRNTDAWESTHASKRGMSDGQMFRANVVGVRLIETALLQGEAWIDAARELVRADRRLPHGLTMRQVLGRRYGEAARHVFAYGELLDECDLEAGREVTIRDRVASMGWSGTDWFGLPEWRGRVEAFCRAVDDVAHQHWGRGGENYPTAERPAQIARTADLRRILLEDPAELSDESAEWCVSRALLRYVRLDRA